MYQRIIVGTDGSKTAAKAVQRAVDIAESSGASLTILTAAKPSKGQSVVDAAKAAHAGSSAEIDTLVVDADPVSALIETARTGGYDLLVVGNKGMTGVRRFLEIGAVPNKLSHHLPTSMLVVRTT
ncbi:universal stress protein [Actinospongicola halichondriae]|uniref:universal stress protein n=1 Tax=Actinospongicola halichondriae TaxID=3236844 RepID=UPI003D5CD964